MRYSDPTWCTYSEKEHDSDDDLHEGHRVTRTKKVSFAEENEQFNLKPDPDVKVIPGLVINSIIFFFTNKDRLASAVLDGVLDSL